MRLVRGSALPVAAALALGGVMLPATTASAAGICEKYGTETAGSYVIMNNLWGAGTRQCIETTGKGFRITEAAHNNATNGAPASYPAIYYGCHYGNCSPGTVLPLPVSDPRVQNMTSTVSMEYPASGEWDAAYDIWYDPTPRRTGQNTGMEIMIWMNHLGRPQPIGSKVGTATINGITWDVWHGNPGWQVVSFVAQSPQTTMSFKPHDFFMETVRLGHGQQSWYLTSLQAGFEPWIGGTGLAVTDFSVTPG